MSDGIGIKNEIKKLIQLQEMDSHLFDLKSQLETFPERLNEMDESLEAKKGGMEEAEEDLKRLKVLKGEKETDMQAKEEKIKKHDGELYQIKNNKEYQALQQEIDSIKADVSLVEEEIIKLFDEIEAAQGRFEEEKKKFEEERESVEKEKGVIEEEEKKFSLELDGLKAKRGEFTSGISSGVLGKYQRILDKRGKTALAKVEGNFCSECNMQLRPQIINEAKLQKALVFCENCTRILYAEE